MKHTIVIIASFLMGPLIVAGIAIGFVIVAIRAGTEVAEKAVGTIAEWAEGD